MNSPKPENIPLSFILVLFYVSGAVALVYQVVWSRQAIIGINLSTLYSVNTFGAVSGVLLTGSCLPNCMALDRVNMMKRAQSLYETQ